MTDMLIDQTLLVLSWIAYAAIHSLLASDPAKALVAERWPAIGCRYRLAFNLLSILLLLPVALLIHATPGPGVWAWTGVGFWLANGLAVLAVMALVAVPTGYDTRAFAGLSSESPAFVIGPWHRVVRHPWYFVGLVVVWTRDMNLATLVSAVAITLYLIVGSRLEEARLARQLGEPYREYLKRVPGLFPLPWRVLDKETARRMASRSG